MRIGAFIPPWGMEAGKESFDRLAQAISTLGLDSLWVGDHVVFPRRVKSSYPYNVEQRGSPFDPDEALYEPLTLLAYLAAKTPRVRLGISVLVLPMRNPVVVAKMLACIDALSQGRIVVGVGVGWMKEEFDALGAQFSSRGMIAEEYIHILRALWGPDNEGYDGRFYSFNPLGFVPRPERSIPIVVGGNSDVAVRRAARIGDGWHPLRLSVNEVKRCIERLKRLAQASSRDPDSIDVILRAPVAFDPDDDVPPFALSGVPGAIAERLEAYRQAGVDEFVVEFTDASMQERIAGLQRFVEEVVPAMASS